MEEEAFRSAAAAKVFPEGSRMPQKRGRALFQSETEKHGTVKTVPRFLTLLMVLCFATPFFVKSRSGGRKMLAPFLLLCRSFKAFVPTSTPHIGEKVLCAGRFRFPEARKSELQDRTAFSLLQTTGMERYPLSGGAKPNIRCAGRGGTSIFIQIVCSIARFSLVKKRGAGEGEYPCVSNIRSFFHRRKSGAGQNA